jgi:hypothetical protein
MKGVAMLQSGTFPQCGTSLQIRTYISKKYTPLKRAAMPQYVTYISKKNRN